MRIHFAAVFPNSNMAISEAETSTAPVLLKESDVTEASVSGRKPAELGKACLFFGSDMQA